MITEVGAFVCIGILGAVVYFLRLRIKELEKRAGSYATKYSLNLQTFDYEAAIATAVEDALQDLDISCDCDADHWPYSSSDCDCEDFGPDIQDLRDDLDRAIFDLKNEVEQALRVVRKHVG